MRSYILTPLERREILEYRESGKKSSLMILIIQRANYNYTTLKDDLETIKTLLEGEE